MLYVHADLDGNQDVYYYATNEFHDDVDLYDYLLIYNSNELNIDQRQQLVL